MAHFLPGGKAHVVAALHAVACLAQDQRQLAIQNQQVFFFLHVVMQRAGLFAWCQLLATHAYMLRAPEFAQLLITHAKAAALLITFPRHAVGAKRFTGAVGIAAGFLFHQAGSWLVVSAIWRRVVCRQGQLAPST